MTDEQLERMLTHHDVALRKLEEQLAETTKAINDNHAHHETALRKLEELQWENQIAISRTNNQIAGFGEKVDNTPERLAALIETFIQYPGLAR